MRLVHAAVLGKNVKIRAFKILNILKIIFIKSEFVLLVPADFNSFAVLLSDL